MKTKKCTEILQEYVKDGYTYIEIHLYDGNIIIYTHGNEIIFGTNCFIMKGNNYSMAINNIDIKEIVI